MTSFSIHPDTSLGPVHLTVADLPRSIGFYQDVVGLQVLARSDQRVSLGTTDGLSLLVLVENAQCSAKTATHHRSLPLCHFVAQPPGSGAFACSI